MRVEYIKQEFEKADVLNVIDPKEIAKEAKLSLIYRLMFVIVWPKIKPFISAKIGAKFADLIEQILGGI